MQTKNCFLVRIVISSFLYALFIFGTLNAQSAIQPTTGKGSIDDPYQIASLENLFWIAAPDSIVSEPNREARFSSHYIQVTDIDASSTQTWYPNSEDEYCGWSPIGGYIQFSGSYNGGNFNISGLFLNRSESYLGLFGYTNSESSLKNIHLINININANYPNQNYVGGLVGLCMGTIENCSAEVNIICARTTGGLAGELYTSGIITESYTEGTLSAPNAGGLVGINRGTILDSYSSIAVTGNQAGGLVSYNEGLIENCSSSGIVEDNGISALIGGLVSQNSGTINYSFSTSNVVASAYATASAGGLVGSNLLIIKNSYSSGNVTGFTSVGGLAAVNSGSSSVIENCYATGNVIDNYSWWTMSVGGLVGSNNSGLILNSFSRGSILKNHDSDVNNIGGFLGKNDKGIVKNCYSTGSVEYYYSANPQDKGFTGGVDTLGNYEMTGNYWDIETSGQFSTIGEAEGRLTSEMTYPYDINTYYDWNFEFVWAKDTAYTINEGYPYLLFQSGTINIFEIENVRITNLNSISTKIEWKTTNPASGFIFYALEDTSNGYPLEAMETSGNVMEHSLILSGLTTGSTYYFIIDQTDENSNWVRSVPYSFVAGEINSGEQIPFDSALVSLKKLDNTPDIEGSVYYDGAFLSKDVAYIVSDHNRLFKTVNGGQTWVDVSPEYGTNFEGIGACPKVHFFNENIGAVAFSLDDGSNNYDYDIVFGYVWVTRDGGQTWSERFDVNEDQILHLEQVAENVTYISGASAFGVSSNKWFKKISYNPSTSSFSIADVTPTPDDRPHVMSGDWLDENNGIILAKLNYGSYDLSVFKTSNGGASWSNISGDLSNIIMAQTSFSDRSIQMIDEDTFIFSYYYPDGNNYETMIWATENGGANWFQTPIEDSGVMLNSLSIHESADYGLVCGFNPDSTKTFYVMYSESTIWQSFQLPDIEGGTGLYANELCADGTIWVIGSNRSIWKSNSTTTSIENNEEIIKPEKFVLYQNYPNPFNPSTVIRYSLPVRQAGIPAVDALSPGEVHVSLIIYDILGNEITTLVNENQSAGNYEMKFDGRRLSSGVYFYRLIAGNFIQTKKMLLTK